MCYCQVSANVTSSTQETSANINERRRRRRCSCSCCCNSLWPIGTIGDQSNSSYSTAAFRLIDSWQFVAKSPSITVDCTDVNSTVNASRSTAGLGLHLGHAPADARFFSIGTHADRKHKNFLGLDIICAESVFSDSDWSVNGM